MQDRERFDMELEAPLPGRPVRAGAVDRIAETDTLRAVGMWANQVQAGG